MSIIAKGVGAILVHELRSARAMHRRERGRRPGRSLEWLKFKKLTARKSGIQARHLYISARKRSGLRHAGKLAYPAKPLNVESLDRPIWAHKKQGNHPAGVIVDMQFPCHSTPRPTPPVRAQCAESACWFRCAEPVGSTVGATCQCRLAIVCYAGKGQSKRPQCPFRAVRPPRHEFRTAMGVTADMRRGHCSAGPT